MKLQLKFALFNTLTKVFIITLMGIVLLLFIDKISINHIRERLQEKKAKIKAHLSTPEIKDLLATQKSFTDYNLLKEEYISLVEIKKPELMKETFSQEIREIEGASQEYLILTEEFPYQGKQYRLALGETMSTVSQLEDTIFTFTLVILIVAIILTLITDFAFTSFLFAPFYKIIEEKINKVNDPIHFKFDPVKTSTTDFKILDESISMLMNKIKMLFLAEKEFIANVSHELLTPISVLNHRLENIVNNEQLSIEGENKIFASLKTLNRLKSIINSLLMISKIENNQYEKQDTVTISHTIAEVLEDLEDRLVVMDLRLEVKEFSDFQFKGNKSLIFILLMNIINNAIKFNTPGGSITISAERTADSFCLTIADTGVGMDQEQVTQIFTRFEKLQSERTDSFGLGLAIVKSIASFHYIGVEIQAKRGKGTSVRLLFPSS